MEEEEEEAILQNTVKQNDRLVFVFFLSHVECPFPGRPRLPLLWSVCGILRTAVMSPPPTPKLTPCDRPVLLSMPVLQDEVALSLACSIWLCK